MNCTTRNKIIDTALEIAGGILLFALIGITMFLVMIATDYHWC